ncbi:hypothetical protein C1N87_28630 (plasmid) [Priestia aryabhattai]
MREDRNFIVLTLRFIGIIVITFGLYLSYYIGNTSELIFIFKTYTQIIALIVGITAVASGIAILGRAEQAKML